MFPTRIIQLPYGKHLCQYERGCTLRDKLFMKEPYALYSSPQQCFHQTLMKKAIELTILPTKI